MKRLIPSPTQQMREKRDGGRGTGGNIGPWLDIAAELASTVQYQELKAPKGDACRIRDVEASAPDSPAAMG